MNHLSYLVGYPSRGSPGTLRTKHIVKLPLAEVKKVRVTRSHARSWTGDTTLSIGPARNVSFWFLLVNQIDKAGIC